MELIKWPGWGPWVLRVSLLLNFGLINLAAASLKQSFKSLAQPLLGVSFFEWVPLFGG